MPISGATSANYSGMMANSAGMMKGMMGNSSRMMNSSMMMMRNTPGANGLAQASKTESTFESKDSINKQGKTDKTNSPNANNLSETFKIYNSSGNAKQFSSQEQSILNQLL